MKKRKKNTTNAVTRSQLTFHKLDWLEWITMGLALWFVFYPRPYVFLFSILLAMPVIGLLLNGIQKPSMASLVTISKDHKGEIDYDVADFIDAAAWVILLRVLIDYEFESWYSLIIPGTIACVIMLTVLFLTHRLIEANRKNKTWIYLSLLFNICVYSYAGTYGANCIYDFSDPVIYKAEVVDKHSSGSKHTTYYLKVTAWGNRYDNENVSVSREQYNATEIGTTVEIKLKKGLFNIPWFYVARE
jgi:hypothetical protein